MGGKDSSMGMVLELGRGGVDQKPRAENLVLCKEARVVSWERGRWQMERILP